MAFVKHEPCPQCGSKDNLGRYSDGSGWCFGCRYYERPTKPWTEPTDNPGARPCPLLVRDIPNKFLAYYRKYGLTDEEIFTNFGYSIRYDRCVYKCGDFWEARSVDREPKTLSFGQKPWHMLGYWQRIEVCLVEDIVSAIKVARVMPVVCLFGSHLKPEYLLQLMSRPVYIWLDADKLKEAFSMAERVGNASGKKPTVVYTQLDPKEYTTEEIARYLA